MAGWMMHREAREVVSWKECRRNLVHGLCERGCMVRTCAFGFPRYLSVISGFRAGVNKTAGADRRFGKSEDFCLGLLSAPRTP